MSTETFFVKNGIASIYKSPGAELPYGLNLVDWMRMAGMGIGSVFVKDVIGVTQVGEPFIDGTCIGALFRGLDESESALNCATFQWVGADGQTGDERTIHFVKRPVRTLA